MDAKPFGRYRLVELLGHGGMGEVWRAFDTEASRTVAVKILIEHLAEDHSFQQRFRREALAVSSLNSPHVIPIHHFGEIDGHLYVDMPLIEGRDLDSLLADGPLEPRRAVDIIDQVAAALSEAHRAGVVHRDVKPANVLIDGNDFAYLIDFGLAHAGEGTRITHVGNAIGTWAYMAPERFISPDVDPRSDVYALACVLYECLTAQRPYPGDEMQIQYAGHTSAPPPRPSAARAGLPIGFDAVIAIGMAKNPARRYPTPHLLARAAVQAAQSPVIRRPQPQARTQEASVLPCAQSVAPRTPPTTRRVDSRRRWNTALSVAAAVVLIPAFVTAGAAIVVRFDDRKSDTPLPQASSHSSSSTTTTAASSPTAPAPPPSSTSQEPTAGDAIDAIPAAMLDNATCLSSTREEATCAQTNGRTVRAVVDSQAYCSNCERIDERTDSEVAYAFLDGDGELEPLHAIWAYAADPYVLLTVYALEGESRESFLDWWAAHV